jgi:hypothetical protein
MGCMWLVKDYGFRRGKHFPCGGQVVCGCETFFHNCVRWCRYCGVYGGGCGIYIRCVVRCFECVWGVLIGCG